MIVSSEHEIVSYVINRNYFLLSTGAIFRHFPLNYSVSKFFLMFLAI